MVRLHPHNLFSLMLASLFLPSCAAPQHAAIRSPSGESCTIAREDHGTLPMGVYGATVSAYDGSFYIAGGMVGVDGQSWGAISFMIGRWSPDTKQFEVISKDLTPRRYAASVAYDGGIYVVGGQGRDRRALGTLERFDLSTRRLTTLSPMPTPRSFVGAALFDDRIFVAGGRLDDKTRTSVVEVYDLRSDRWSTAAPLAQTRDAKLVVVDGSLYALGGYDGTSARPIVERWVPKSGVWEKVAPMPEPTSAYSAAAAGQTVLTFGDYKDHERVLQYDPQADVWKESGLPFTPRRHSAAASTGNRVFVVGGNRASTRSYLGDYEVYAVSCKPNGGRVASAETSSQQQGGR